MQDNNKFLRCVAGVFVIFIFGMMAYNISLVKAPVKNFVKAKTTFKQLTKDIGDNYVKKLNRKDTFINLNGLFVRRCGKITHNNIVVLKNNMLNGYSKSKKGDVKYSINSITKFDNWLKEKNISFVQVVAPYKVTTSKDNLPDGIEDYVNDEVDDFVTELSKNGVHTIDLRQLMSTNIDEVNKYFYRTDHHWNTDAAFLAFGKIMKEINLGDRYTGKDVWERNEIKDWFLGSQGKRVGAWFTGTDSLVYYMPRFDTKMSCIVPHHKNIFKGDFVKANIRRQYIEKKNYFGYNAYCVYIGGDYPLTQHRNSRATNDKRLLILKDSFTLPLQSFLSTEFSEIDVIDPRHYHASSIAEYIMWTRPDLVIKINSCGTFKGKQYNDLGINEIREYSKIELLKNYIVELAKSKSNYNYRKIPVKIKEGSIYTVGVDSIEVKEGKTDGVSILLYDFKKKKILRHEIVDVEYCNLKRQFQWTFKVPAEKSDYALLVYSGLHGKTKGVGIKISDIRVHERI